MISASVRCSGRSRSIAFHSESQRWSRYVVCWSNDLLAHVVQRKRQVCWSNDLLAHACAAATTGGRIERQDTSSAEEKRIGIVAIDALGQRTTFNYTSLGPVGQSGERSCPTAAWKGTSSQQAATSWSSPKSWLGRSPQKTAGWLGEGHSAVSILAHEAPHRWWRGSSQGVRPRGQLTLGFTHPFPARPFHETMVSSWRMAEPSGLPYLSS